ncbi:ARM repeat-containing protein [Patellaria atrata CBS 101060]|uniref:ARM repeat-containing protein n=1 Tax=Patellaria atrata CBS 101060 TaxID=1346257 RepID=A0A9P4SIR3_9PEZI|nr:ARM repeat-containing protein [Patellaria atrata CBS 101060]
MAGIKRKQESDITKSVKSKKLKPISTVGKPAIPSKKSEGKVEFESEELIESDTSEDDNGFYGFSAKEGDSKDLEDTHSEDEEHEGARLPRSSKPSLQKNISGGGPSTILNGTNSRETHAKQKALAKERKAAKPNANSIHRSKKIWERLRIKSAVAKEERQQLVEELFDIITGKIKDFVFKHDAVRAVQCALKYANAEQRIMIAQELKGDYKTLAESRYAKFLVAKLIVSGGDKVRDMIVPEFYGHVKRLINHPEAAWILDDIYRGVATKSQKAILLREWYGAEFSLFESSEKDSTADLSSILTTAPEKRTPILKYLHRMINQLVQKKMTAFTMLHDAMLQYYLNLKPSSEESAEFLELLKGDEEGDLLKNLAFTASGSQVICFTLAYGTPKDRRHILKAYKDNIESLAFDKHGHQILLTAYEVIDDTVTTSKSIFPELIGKEPGDAQYEKVLSLTNHIIGRAALMYPLTGISRHLIPTHVVNLMKKVVEIRKDTSKKDPATRREELIRGISTPILSTIVARAQDLVTTGYGCHLITDALLEASGDKSAAVSAVAVTAAGDPNAEKHIANSSHAGRMLKTLVQGGRFNVESKEIVRANPPLEFGNALYEVVKEWVGDWAIGQSSFVIVNMIEAEDFSHSEALLKALKKKRKEIRKAAEIGGKDEEPAKSKKAENGTQKKVDQKWKGNLGARLLLERLQ